MDIRNTLIPFIILSLTLLVSQNAVAAKVFQWTDEDDSVHFSNVHPEDTSTKIAYRNASAGKIYKWTDKEGSVHFSDVPPEKTSVIDMLEINFDSFDDNNADPEKYSIINQADRMAERRRQVTEERLARRRLKLEERQTAQELEMIRQNELYNTQGYGPRSYSYAYPQYNSNYYRGYGYQSRGYGHYPRRYAQHRQSYSHYSRRGHHGRFSGSHLRFNAGHLRFGIRF